MVCSFGWLLSIIFDRFRELEKFSRSDRYQKNMYGLENEKNMSLGSSRYSADARSLGGTVPHASVYSGEHGLLITFRVSVFDSFMSFQLFL